MSTTGEPGESTSSVRYDSRRLERRLAIGLVVGLVVGALLAVWATWMLGHYFVLHDDSDRGARLADTIDPATRAATETRRSSIEDQCRIAAQAFYGHDIANGHDDGATPEEKAFFVACSGVPVGGLGGGAD